MEENNNQMYPNTNGNPVQSQVPQQPVQQPIQQPVQTQQQVPVQPVQQVQQTMEQSTVQEQPVQPQQIGSTFGGQVNVVNPPSLEQQQAQYAERKKAEQRAEYTIIKNDDKVKSILSYVISICAIIFLLDKSSSIRLKYICAQSIIIWAITVCVAFIPIIQFFGWIFSAIFVIWGIVQVAGDEPYPTLPVIGNLAESIFGAIIHRKPEIVAKPKPQPTKVPGTESQQAQQTQQTQQVVQQPAQSVPPVQPNNNNTQQ